MLDRGGDETQGRLARNHKHIAALTPAMSATSRSLSPPLNTNPLAAKRQSVGSLSFGNWRWASSLPLSASPPWLDRKFAEIAAHE